MGCKGRNTFRDYVAAAASVHCRAAGTAMGPLRWGLAMLSVEVNGRSDGLRQAELGESGGRTLLLHLAPFPNWQKPEELELLV